MTLSNTKHKNDSFSELEKSTKRTGLDPIIKDVKTQIRRHYAGYKEQVERLGHALKKEKLIKEKDICTEIKNALREEIKEKIISSDTIERCCPDEWKRKIKPKGIREPQLRFSEDKNPQEEATVTNVNTIVSSEGQLLQQEFKQDESKKVEDQKPVRRTTDLPKEAQQQKVAQLDREHESYVDKSKEEVWAASKVLNLGNIQLPLKVSVNCTQKKIEYVELDFEKYSINDTS